MKNQSIANKSEIIKRLEAFQEDLLSIRVNDILKIRVVDSLIFKVNIIIEICNYNPRLPLYDIENRIIEMYKKDSSIHGVNVQFLFNNKNAEIDKSRIANLIVKL